MSSRYIIHDPLPAKRLKAFVALDNLTAQTPLIEIVRKQPFHTRIWVAYDYERVHGTYLAVYFSGMVKRITVYPNGKRDDVLVRPADR